MSFLQSLAGVPFGLLLLAAGAVVVTVRDPRRVSAAILWGLTANALIVFLIGALDGTLWEISEEASIWVILGMFAGVYLSVLLLALLLIAAGLKLIRLESFSLSHSLALAMGLLILVYLAAVPLVLSRNLEQLGVLFLFLGLPLGYLAFMLTSYLGYSWAYARWVSGVASPAEVIVVLGAGLNGEELTPLLRARADLGIAEYRKSVARGNDPVLVGSGGQGADEVIPEGVAIGRYVRAQGVPNVVEETKSQTTEQNLEYSRELMETERAPWLAVTSDYHAFRAAVLMRQLGIPGNALGAKTPRYFWSSAVLREYVALLARYWKLNLALVLVFSIPLLSYLVALVRGLLISV